jgi:glyoxylase-like metal-dependent hydrolase (beta-lactamase superfamily II)
MVHRFIPALLAVAALVPAGTVAANADEPVYEAYAVRYARLREFPVSALVQGADEKRRLDLAMMVWVLKGPERRTVLVDAGFYRRPFVERETVADYVRPDKAVERLGIRPGDVTDVVVTHMHWDHADGVDLFPKARVSIQKDEFDYYTKDGQPDDKNPDRRPEFVHAMLRLHQEGRVRLVDRDAREIVPGVTVYTGGRHTFASQYVGVRTRAGCVVIASDNVYLYENLDKHVPIAQTFDAQANLRAQDRMKALAASTKLIVPGHDPEVFARFPKVDEGIARLD